MEKLAFLMLITTAIYMYYLNLGHSKNTAISPPAISSVSSSVPASLEVCFSPDEPCESKLREFIDSAQKSLDVAIYDVTLPSIANLLIAKSKSIPVRIIVDRKQAKGERSLVKELIRGGAQVRFGRQKGIMHNKFTIKDGNILETGSFNYTNNATFNNNENQLYIADRDVVGRYSKRFEGLWARAKPGGIDELE